MCFSLKGLATISRAPGASSRALPAQRTGLATRDFTHLRGLKTIILISGDVYDGH